MKSGLNFHPKQIWLEQTYENFLVIEKKNPCHVSAAQELTLARFNLYWPTINEPNFHYNYDLESKIAARLGQGCSESKGEIACQKNPKKANEYANREKLTLKSQRHGTESTQFLSEFGTATGSTPCKYSL